MRKGIDFNGEALWIFLGIESGKSLGDHREIGFRFPAGDAGAKMGNHSPIVSKTAAGTDFDSIRTAWKPQFDAAPGEARSHDADERPGDTVQVEGLADKSRIGLELADPSGVAQNKNRRSTGLEVGGFEGAAQERRDAEKFERARGDVVSAEAESGLSGGVDDVVFEVGDDSVEDVILSHVLAEFGIEECAAPFTIGTIPVVDPDDDKVAGIFVGEGLKERVVHDAEDGGGSADAEGESKNGDESKTAIFHKTAKCKSKVAGKDLQMIFPAGFSALFLEA